MLESGRGERSLAALISQLTFETTTLFRKEIELAKAEVGQKVSQAGSGLVEIGIGGGVLFVGIQALTAAAILALGLVVDWWLAALIVGVVVAVIGWMVLSRGLSHLKAERLMPHRTIGSLKENTIWAREQLR